MRDAAAVVLAKHGALEHFAEREATRVELEALGRELALARGQVPWWERSAVPTPVDPGRLAAVEQRIVALAAVDAARQAALQGALDAASVEMPPIEIARRVMGCVGLARAGANTAAAHSDVVAGALETLADRVLAIWAPALSTDAAVAELMDPARAAHAASTDPGPPRADAHLGWAPAAPGEIVARAARALRRPEIDVARARIVREHGEYEAAAARLRELRKGASVLRRLTGNDAADLAASEYAARCAAVEHHELTAAWETLHHEVSHALASVPPLHVARAAVAAAGVVRARLTTWEIVIGHNLELPGTLAFFRTVSRRGPALLFAALNELRTATEAAFPGLLELITPRGAAVAAKEVGSAAVAAGPYRAPPEADDGSERAEPRGADLVAAVIERARKGGLDARLGALVAHGAALGNISREKKRVEAERGLFDKVSAWASSEDDPREARARWHRALAFAMLDHAEATVAGARRGCFALDLRAALCAAAAQFFAIEVVADRSWNDVQCSLRRHAETVNALLAARRHLVEAWGNPGDRLGLANDVAGYLGSTSRGPSPLGAGAAPRRLHRHELVVLLAESLRGTAFLDAVSRASAAQRGYVDAGKSAADAEARITFWDQLNFFTDSEAEATRKEQIALGQELFATGRQAFAQMNELLEQALRGYPPAVVLYRLEEALALVGQVRAVKVYVRTGKSGHYECQLWGKPAAKQALDRLATAAGQTFGVMLSDTEILAHHWERLLDAPT